MAQHSQFDLLRTRRFGPYFVTQLLGAFNDNVYKNALVALLAFAPALVQGGDASKSTLLINLSAGLFILPFFLFSAIAGQVADKYEKSMLIRRIKIAEIGIMTCGSIALITGNLSWLMGILFLMGTQSAFFGPIKYGILPQHLKTHELIGGNGLVEMGTFLAILFGTIIGTQIIIKAPGGSVLPTVCLILFIAAVGYWWSRKIPAAESHDPNLQLRFNPATETVKLINYTRKHRVIFQTILGISWFWFLGATYLAQFPVYSRDVLGGTGDVFTLLLALFSIGIGIGSALCEKLSHGQVEIGLVPFGSIGLTLAGLDLYFATPSTPLGVDLGVVGFISAAGSFRILCDVLIIGLFGGFFIVPLYALIQKLSRPDRLARAIACNNIMNALFMVGSALLVILLFKVANLSIKQLFGLLALMNALVAIYLFRLVPEFLMRFLIWMLIHTCYRVKSIDLDKIPKDGAAVLAANHVSFVDALVVGGTIRRPVRFVMYHKIYNLPILNFVFKTAKAIPIAGAKEDKTMYDSAFEEMRRAVDEGDLLCIFPEGQITHDGEMNDFRPGIERLIADRPAPVVPIALRGLWGSLFSRSGGRALLKMPRRLFARIDIVAGDPIPATDVTAAKLQKTVLELRGDKR
ncbi:MAG: MFS transporter [Gammaproteobacteria bacterium]|nr:MFS transporter [Gammaproteobacteria bacterium]